MTVEKVLRLEHGTRTMRERERAYLEATLKQNSVYIVLRFLYSSQSHNQCLHGSFYLHGTTHPLPPSLLPLGVSISIYE